MKNTILFIYNWVENKADQFIECATKTTVDCIKNALNLSGFEVIPLNLYNIAQLRDSIKQINPTLAFVIAEGFLDNPETLFDGSGSTLIREILAEMNVPYTHSTPSGMINCRNKDITYKILRETNVPVPDSFVLPNATLFKNYINDIEETIAYPMFVKPTGGGNSIGIDNSSIVYNRHELQAKVNGLTALIGDSSIIIETFLSGREYTVGVMGNFTTTVLPVIAFPKDYQVRSYKIKKTESKDKNNIEVFFYNDPLYQKVCPIALNTFSALKVNDVIRIDIKEDSLGNPMVIDVNGSPSLAPGGSLAFMAQNMDISHGELINMLLWESMQRFKINPTPELLRVKEGINLRIKHYSENFVA
ncbi:D-alanine--D-alanine ligase family protein [Desulfitibacter alkalitolerans]|uniref:D-alanine--D-alanine ligase family protein n=1 Tax=Desulfitibacter alkalitolerans TaxID=264641 RepID=UPI0004844A52|nr:ATP-grasp domain-containing protein [Desulfitibacter alkalitolerans]